MDYYIMSIKEKRVHEVQLDLLVKFQHICKKYNLHYFADGGTLLGAVRHQGFIPWDDDIDVAMMWSDYQKFMEVAPKECQYPYVYQCPFTEQEALIEASRLRRSDTTGFTKWEHENVGKQYDRGIFLDIFPMFYIPDSEEERRAQKEIVLYYWRVIRGYEALQYKKRTGSLNPSYNSYIPVFQEYYKKMGSQSIDIFNLKKQYLDACAWENVRSKEVGYTS